MNSPSFEFIQSSKIKIHNKLISKTPFFFLTAQTPKLPFPTKHYITIITKFQKYPKPRTLISKKLQNLNQTTTSQASRSRFVQTTTTTQIHNTTITSRTTKLTYPSIIGAWKRVNKIQRVVNKGDLPEADSKSFSDSRETNTPPPLSLDSIGFGKRKKPKRETEIETEVDD